jgi:hypothetical protein
MENSHRRIVAELRDEHEQQIQQMKHEKEEALAEETQATLAGTAHRNVLLGTLLWHWCGFSSWCDEEGARGRSAEGDWKVQSSVPGEVEGFPWRPTTETRPRVRANQLLRFFTGELILVSNYQARDEQRPERNSIPVRKVFTEVHGGGPIGGAAFLKLSTSSAEPADHLWTGQQVKSENISQGIF